MPPSFSTSGVAAGLRGRAAVPAGDNPPGLPGPAESGREAASPEPAAMAGALERLTEVLALQTQSAAERPSTLTVKPTLTWPSLGDNDFDVDAFFEEFEEICGLENNG